MFKPRNILSERIANLKAENDALKAMGVFIALRQIATNPNYAVFSSEEWSEFKIAYDIVADAISVMEADTE